MGDGELSERWIQLFWTAGITTANCWCTWKICLDCYKSCYSSSHQSNTQKTPAIKRTMMITCVTSALFTIAVLIYLSAYLIFIHHLGWYKHATTDEERTASLKVSYIYFTSVIIQIMSLCVFLIVCFLRMKQTFQGSLFEVTDQQTYLFYSIISFCMILFGIICPYAAFLIATNGNRNQAWIYILLFLLLLSYIFSSIWVCKKFYNSIRNLVSNNDSGSNPATSAMLNVALKIKLLSITALLSTWLWAFTYAVSVGLAFMHQWRAWLIAWKIVTFVTNLDPLINNVVLLLFMKQNQKWYDRLYGTVHRYLFDRLKPTNQMIQSVSETSGVVSDDFQ